MQTHTHAEVSIRCPARSIRVIGMACVLLLGIGGCANKIAGGPYERPELPSKSNWSQLEGRELSVSEVIHPEWWHGFGDPVLNQLIDEALEQSLEMSAATLRLRQAGIDLKDRQRSQFPEFNLDPSASVQGGKQQTTVDTNNVALNVSWEIDIWGAVRRDVRAQAATLQATEMQWRGTYLKLISDVASRYFTIRQFDEQIAYQESSLDNSRNLLNIYRQQFDEGMVPRTLVLNQQSEVNGLSTQLVELKRIRAETEMRLGTLLGYPAGEFQVRDGRLEDLSPIDVPSVLPGDILSQRPDVLAAEFSVLRAHQLLGRARLARLPRLNLVSNLNLAELVTTTWTWGLTSSLAGMFDRKVGVDIKTNEVSMESSVVEYRRSVLNAFEEVEIALLNLRAHQEQMELLEDQITDLKTVRDVNLARLKEGLISQLEMFETERTLLGAQQGWLAAYQQVLTDTVVLYIALGGGWPTEAVDERSVVSSSR